MVGMRKFTITVMYLLTAGFVSIKCAEAGTDGTGIALICTGLATGVGCFVYGNSRENQARAMATITGRSGKG